MNRKKTLQSILLQYVAYDNQGSYKQRQLQRFILTKIIDDLCLLRSIPPTWHGLTKQHIEKLVLHWKKNGLKNATLMNYLACLRSFLKIIEHRIDGIENSSLNLTKSRKRTKPVLERDEVLTCIQEPIAKILFALQSYFGLTLSEAMKLIPSIHISDKGLCLTRDISSNSKDRAIPIQTEKQRLITQALQLQLKPFQSLISRFSESYIRLAYGYALKSISLPTNIHYRYLYARARLKELKALPVVAQIEWIKKEMGINANSTLWSYCHE